jgi:hypothetical protein
MLNERIDRQALISLWRGVVLQALRDASCGGGIGTGAIQWIDSDHCREICEIIGVNYRLVRQAAYRFARKQAVVPEVKYGLRQRHRL